MKLKEKITSNIILRTIFVLSCPFLTLLLSNRYDDIFVYIGCFLSFIIAFILQKKFSKLFKINKRNFFLALIISLYVLGFFINIDNLTINNLKTVISNNLGIYLEDSLYKVIALLSLPSLTIIIYLLNIKIVPNIKNFFIGLSRIEKRYLIIISILGFFIAFLSNTLTTAFSIPYHDGNLKVYDVLYTTDSGSLVYSDTYFNVSFVENDVRQPLFGVFAIPFSIIAKVLAQLLFFLPSSFEYATMMCFIQFILLAITTILIARMLKLEEKEKKYLYLLFSVSFPYLIFSIILEQYVIGLFYLILAVYYFYVSKEKVNYLYIGSVGTMITSGIIFPLISKGKTFKKWIQDVFKCFLAFISVFIISGQLPQLLLFVSRFRELTTSFALKLSFTDKLYQFLNFVKATLIAPAGHMKMIDSFPTYQLQEVKYISIIGLILLILAIVSYIVNRKNKFAKFSFLWIVFSIVLLLIVGWGTTENGLVLYSLYFSFAYLSLYFLLLKKIFKNRKIFVVVTLLLITTVFILNINEITNIFRFAIEYY